MASLFLSFIVWVLATQQAVEIWHHSALFEKHRFRLETTRGRLWALTSCPWCLSVWVAGVVVAVTGFLAVPPSLLQWPAIILAVSRGANLVNDLTHPWVRTPGRAGWSEGEKEVFNGAEDGEKDPEKSCPESLSDGPEGSGVYLGHPVSQDDPGESEAGQRGSGGSEHRVNGGSGVVENPEDRGIDPIGFC